jgi:hypothetical protein
LDKMKNKKILFMFVILILGFYIITISSKDVDSIPLIKGKNHVPLNLSEPIYVKTFIDMNPQIEAISYQENNETIGYVNVFDGIGMDFILEEREYEIIVSKDINLIVPS